MLDTEWRDFWSDYSDTAYDYINHLSENQGLLARVAELAGTGGSVLDAGCGTGNLTVLLARTNVAVLALDYSPGMVRAAQAKTAQMPNVTVRQGDVCALDVPDGGFDALTSVNVLFNLEHPERAVAEAARALRPGGVLVAASPLHGRAYSPAMVQAVQADAAASAVQADELGEIWRYQSRLATGGGVRYAPTQAEFTTLLAAHDFEVCTWDEVYYGANFLVQARKR